MTDQFTLQVEDSTSTGSARDRQDVVLHALIERILAHKTSGGGDKRAAAGHGCWVPDRQHRIVLPQQVRIRQTGWSQGHPLGRPEQRHVAPFHRVIFATIDVVWVAVNTRFTDQDRVDILPLVGPECRLLSDVQLGHAMVVGHDQVIGDRDARAQAGHAEVIVAGVLLAHRTTGLSREHDRSLAGDVKRVAVESGLRKARCGELIAPVDDLEAGLVESQRVRRPRRGG